MSTFNCSFGFIYAGCGLRHTRVFLIERYTSLSSQKKKGKKKHITMCSPLCGAVCLDWSLYFRMHSELLSCIAIVGHDATEMELVLFLERKLRERD